MNAAAAQAWFIAGTIPLVFAGALHTLYGLRDTARPTYFAPVDRTVKSAMEGTVMQMRRGAAGPSVWRVWLGVHLTHGLGIFTFALLCLLIATSDFELIEQVDAIRPLTIAFSAALFVICLRFFFYVPALLAGASTACFVVAAVLSA